VGRHHKKIGAKKNKKKYFPECLVPSTRGRPLPRVPCPQHSGKRGPGTQGRGPFPVCHAAALGKASRPVSPSATGPSGPVSPPHSNPRPYSNPPNSPSPPHTPPPAPLPPSARARWSTPLPAPAPAHPTPPHPTPPNNRPPTPAAPTPTSDPHGGGAGRSGESRAGRSGERERDGGGLVLLPATASCSSRRRPRAPPDGGLDLPPGVASPTRPRPPSPARCGGDARTAASSTAKTVWVWRDGRRDRRRVGLRRARGRRPPRRDLGMAAVERGAPGLRGCG
jgi:hypothetical protein